MHLSVRVFICTSLLAASVVTAGDRSLTEGGVAALEIEARLARSSGIYLVLDAPRRVLEIKARGLLLDSVDLTGIELVGQHKLLGKDVSTTLTLPVVFTITKGPGDNSREIVAPEKLVPEPPENQGEAPQTANPTPEPSPTPVPEPPASYRAQLDNGWDLWITDSLPGETAWARLVAAVEDGWRRLTGHAEHLPTALTLSMTRANTRRLHHLLVKGTPLLVVSDDRG